MKNRNAFLISSILHIFLLGILIVNFNFSKPKPIIMAAHEASEPIHAITVDQTKIDQQIKHLKNIEHRKKQAEEQRIKRLQRQAQQAAQKTKQEEQKLASLDEKRRQYEAKQKQEKAEAIRRENAEKTRLESIKKQREAEELERKMRAEESEMLEKQIKEEQKQLALAQAKRWQTEIDKYTALITHAIGRHWIQPDNLTEDISCVLLIKLSPSGEVIDVNLVTSSGDSILDRSATNAVHKASPLPVPSDPELFAKFREIRLKVKPEGYII